MWWQIPVAAVLTTGAGGLSFWPLLLVFYGAAVSGGEDATMVVLLGLAGVVAVALSTAVWWVLVGRWWSWLGPATFAVGVLVVGCGVRRGVDVGPHLSRDPPHRS